MISVIRIHNELLGTYGDRGNAEVLNYRAQARNLPLEIVDISYRQEIPTSGDIYLLGGAEDAAQVLSLEGLRRSTNFAKAVGAGAVVLAICAGFQIIGETFTNNRNEKLTGMGFLGVDTVAGEKRFVGEIKVSATFMNQELTGFENHGGFTSLRPGTIPFARVLSGFGNGDGNIDGAISGNVFGTYLHGPVLARNPEFADFLLALVIGRELDPFDDPIANLYARERRKLVK